MLKKYYIVLAKAAQNKKHLLFIDITVTSFATYLGLKKAFSWSMTSWLEMLFRPVIAEGIVWILVLLCIYASIVKIFMIIVAAFPATRVIHTDGEALAQCFITVNREIRDHLSNIGSEPNSVFKSFLQNHKFENNVAYFTDNLAKHVKASLTGANKKDIFISVYMVPSFHNLASARDNLEYICHSPDSTDGIHSKKIKFSDGAHKQYECVKCIEGSTRTQLKLDCSDYYKSRSKRHKNIKHYLGLKLEYNDILLGFLNI